MCALAPEITVNMREFCAQRPGLRTFDEVLEISAETFGS